MTKQITQTTEHNDLIASSLTRLIRFCQKNKQSVLTALGILILAAVIGSAYSARQKKINEASWAAYYTAQTALLSGNETEGFKQIDRIAAEYPGSNAAQYALLLKGDVLYANENFAQAADAYKQLSDAKNPTVYTAATLSLAAALQAAGEYKSSAETVAAFIDKHPDSFALAQAYLTLAQSQELAGNKTEALNAYKHLLEAYTKTYFGAVAKEKIAKLQK